MELSEENVVAHKHANKKTEKVIKFLNSDKTNQYVTGNQIKAYFIMFVKLSAEI
jgi:hypothetical protein